MSTFVQARIVYTNPNFYLYSRQLILMVILSKRVAGGVMIT
jgi:hypothetical protein